MVDIKEPVIKLRDIRKVYRIGEEEYEILKSINLDVYKGDFVAIMGASGSGKTTLLNILGCLDRPTSGSYILDGVEVTKLSERELASIRNQKIGFVFQEFHLIPWATVLENVLLPTVYADGITKEKIDKAIYLLNRLNMGERINFRPNELSGGQRQRVAIVRALINDPAIILADEPTGALDSKTSEEVMEIFGMLNEEGRTIVVVTHDMNVASKAKLIKHIRDGKFIE
ncbi:MAG: ABC transporter ATP-binding protein [Thermosulfidibacteraceae bacterium]